MFGLTIVFTLISSYYTTLYPSLDWYVPHDTAASGTNVVNLTFFHIFESLSLLLCFAYHRHYPKEFNIKSEIVIAGLSNIITNNLLEGFSAFHYDSDSATESCILGIWHYNTVADLTRCITFASVLWYLTSKSTMQYFPLPFTWIFKDLSKFIFEPTCIKVFQQYLEQEERDSRLCV